MTPTEKIKQEAEGKVSKYVFKGLNPSAIELINEVKRSCYIAGATHWSEQAEKLREALEKIQEWQMDNLQIARATDVYRIAGKALTEYQNFLK